MRLLRLLCCVALLGSALAAEQAPDPVTPTPAQARKPDPARLLRDAALRRAQVRVEPKVRIEEARLDRNPDGPDALVAGGMVSCRFHPEPASGTSPKFDCELPGGEVVRIKYGRDNPEIYAEVAATRLLSTLGFPTDRLYVVERVRCFGCPGDPFPKLQGCWRDGKVDRACLGPLNYDAFQDFDAAVIERKLEGLTLEARRVEGWAWRELALIDPALGGASRADVDALRVMAVFLTHWDNKPDNQRLVCLDRGADDDRACRQSLAMIADLGGTFGPFKADLKGWGAAPVWKGSGCTVSMRTLPYGGSGFRDTAISEAGRQLAASLLNRLSDDQIRQLFAGARFDAIVSPDPSARSIDRWVRAFRARRLAITERSSCPA